MVAASLRRTTRFARATPCPASAATTATIPPSSAATSIHSIASSIPRSSVAGDTGPADPTGRGTSRWPDNRVGRSGGGAVLDDGMVIGVCNAAEPVDQEGLFAALGRSMRRSINKGWLRSLSSRLRRPRWCLPWKTRPRPLPPAIRSPPDGRPNRGCESPALRRRPDRLWPPPWLRLQRRLTLRPMTRPALASNEQAVLDQIRRRAGEGKEVVWIIRDHDDPQAKSEVLDPGSGFAGLHQPAFHSRRAAESTSPRDVAGGAQAAGADPGMGHPRRLETSGAVAIDVRFGSTHTGWCHVFRSQRPGLPRTGLKSRRIFIHAHPCGCLKTPPSAAKFASTQITTNFFSLISAVGAGFFHRSPSPTG